MIDLYFKRAQQVALWAILTSFGCTAMAQALLHYDHQQQINQEMMEGLYVKTIVCMRTATRAMLRQGRRDHEQINAFNMESCGRPLYRLLTDQMKWEGEDAAALLLRISDMTITRATI
jgi:hypothetical protein